MDLARRFDRVDVDDQRPAACLLSPRCPPLPPDLDAPSGTLAWLHYGPIGPTTTLTAIHPSLPTLSHHSAPPPPNSQLRAVRDHHPRRCLVRVEPTLREHRGFTGFSLCLLTSTIRPDHPCRVIAPRRAGLPRLLSVIAGVAYKDVDGPYVELLGWTADGRADLRFTLSGRRPTPVVFAELSRASLLLEGRPSPIGRPPLAADDAWRAIAEKAERLQQDHPSWQVSAIALVLGVGERTLYTYRHLLRLERAASARSGPTPLSGG